MAKERIGILEGTFDPIHQGHIQMAISAMDSGRLDRLLIVPAADDAGRPCVVHQEDRWRMTVMACTQDARLIPSRIVLDSQGPVQIVDTLLRLRNQYPKAELFYVLGSDGLVKLKNQAHLEKLFSLCGFLVCPRVPGASLQDLKKEWLQLSEMGGRFSMIRTNPISVSSTDIRERLSAGAATPQLFSPVRAYCALKGLYGFPARLDRADSWIEKLFPALNPRRFTHSVSVALTARRLARLYGINMRQAEEAGLLHDCAKCMPLKQMQRIAREHSLTDDPHMLESSALMHSLVGAWVARNEYGMADPEVLDAIAFHNTGHPGMSPLAMCVCLADFIEPTRDSNPLMENVRILSRFSLERALLMSLEGTAEYVRSRGKYLHPRTQETIAWLKTLPEVRSGARYGK